MVCTGSAAGHIALWDLEKRKLRSEIRSAHDAPVTGMTCLPAQPILVTSSPDNSLKVRVTKTNKLKAITAAEWIPSSTGRHLPYEITLCYLPPDTGERARLNLSHAGWYWIYILQRDGFHLGC